MSACSHFEMIHISQHVNFYLFIRIGNTLSYAHACMSYASLVEITTITTSLSEFMLFV